MNANLKLQVAGLTNRAGILIGAADMIEQYAQVTAAILQENAQLELKVAELTTQLAQKTDEVNRLKVTPQPATT
jgi:cell division septum initiation protein DivIVA